jgi:hypothetical protein
MHLQQTKADSRKSGGPQYFFHHVPEPIKTYLRRKGVCPVVMRTPYGIAESPFMAVGRDHKLLPNGRPVSGSVGHDRIQQASAATQSIGEAIRDWYGLPQGRDFERIDVDVQLDSKGQFILAPLTAHFRGRSRAIEIERLDRPLSITSRYQSPLWIRQIRKIAETRPDDLRWTAAELSRIVGEHLNPSARNIHEVDLLRTAGAFAKLGVVFSPYSVRYYDCSQSLFRFLDYPPYRCPIEIKKESRGFKYQIERYRPLMRAAVFCVRDNLLNAPEHVDVIELVCVTEHLKSLRL